MGVDFPRLESAVTSFISSLYHYETVQKKLDDSDVWVDQDSMISKSLCKLQRARNMTVARNFENAEKAHPDAWARFQTVYIGILR